MSTLYSSTFRSQRIERFALLWFGIAFLTILCHQQIGTGSVSQHLSRSSTPAVLASASGWNTPPDDRKPRANDDELSTQEEIPIQTNILQNDEVDRGDDDDDDDKQDEAIDPTTVDLDPETEPVDKILVTIAGTFTVNNAGELSYVPLLNFFGTSRINYTVRNLRGEKSNKANITASVTNTNDPPVITGQTPDPIEVNEDQSLTIGFGHLIVSDPDNNYPTGFTLTVIDGANYSVNGTTITPDADYSGALSVPVSVYDGTSSSNQFVLSVVVNAVNDVPVITSQTPNPIAATEDQSFSVSTANLTVTDPDDAYPGDFTLEILNGANYTFSGTTVTPSQNFSGTLSVSVAVNDGDASSAPFNVEVSVQNVNDPPVITGQAPNPLSTAEDQPLTIQLANLVVADPDNTYPTGFSLSVAAGENYTVSGTTITPATDFIGTIQVPVTVSDGAASSNQFSVQVNVTGNNDAPVITGQSPLVVDEDNSVTVTLAHLTVTDADNSYPTDFTLSLGTGANYSLAGTTVVPAPNFSGTLTVPATVNDGASNSNTFALTITVNAVNDPPVITGQSTLTTNENTAITLALSNFTVTDPDNAYPTGFTLTVLPGTNYSVTESTVTPAPGFSGQLLVGVQVNDGSANSAVFNTGITVTAVNDPPVITGNNPLTVAEDNSITPQLTDIIVTDTDNTYPTGFSLTVLPGTNYTVSGNTVLPAPNFNGALSVGISVSDGLANSNTYQLPITVTAVNDAPVITGQRPISIVEDQSLAIDLSQLTVVDPDNSFPTGFTLSVFTGVNYTVSGTTITPALDFRGTLSVPVQVSDGVLTSNIFQLQISVADVNDPPVITGQTPVATAEDTPVNITLGNLTVFDPDNNYPTGFTLVIANGANYSVSGTTITPAQDFNGTLNIPVTVSDGAATSAPFNFQIQVGDANDPPVITAQVPLATNEETPITLALNNLTVTDPDNPYPTGFTLIVSAGENYSFLNNVITPVANFTGTLTVPVRVNDGVNNSPTFNLAILVNPVNDAPSFSAIANQTVLENGTPAVVTITGISKGPGEDGQQVTLTASSGNTTVITNPVIAYSGGATAQLSYTLVPNASGVVTITVTATDNGPSGAPHQNSYSSSFQVTVSEINNPPTLDNISNVTMLEDAAVQSIALTGITAGAGESQPLSIEVTSDKPALFETLQLNYTSPQSSATLQIKPAPNSFGIATLTVKVVDNGSNISPSKNSVSKSFTVTVQSVNDPPVFTSIPVVVAAVNEPYEYIVQFTDVETTNLSVVPVSKPGWASLTAVTAGKFRLSGTPPASAQGEFTINLQVKDADQTATQQFKLVVNNRPLAKPVAIAIVEDNGYAFTGTEFANSYSDADQHPLKGIVITQLAPNGKLTLGPDELNANDTIDVGQLAQVKYQPAANYDKPDVFFWKAFDGFHLSASPASVDIKIQPVNDAPIIVLPADTLQFDVAGVPAVVAEMFDIVDPDNDSLSRAEIVFTQNHDVQFDQLIVEPAGNIRGIYEPQSGAVILTGLASIAQYKDVIGKIQYNYLNTLDPLLRMKTLTYTASDGQATSDPKDRLINLKYTFIDLEIPSGFTPNQDGANDYWIITRPGGLEQLNNAVIRVMNKRGVKVYEGEGFLNSWDGTMNGEPLPADTYFFTIDLNLRSKKTYKGTVTILR
ncbi:MAG TPA: tandem-95 repeat protein [Chryseosolibacter sp.]